MRIPFQIQMVQLKRFTPWVLWAMRLWMIFIFSVQGLELIRRIRRGESLGEMIQTMEGMNLFPGLYWAMLPLLGMLASWLLLFNHWVQWAGLALAVISFSGLVGFHGHHLFSLTHPDYQFPLTILLLSLSFMVNASGMDLSEIESYQMKK